MSSGSSSRYQSRLFNFVHQQSRRLTQQWEYTFRHLQVATKKGVDVLFYSVSQLFQSVGSSGKTLYTKESQPRLKLQPSDRDFQPETPPNADIPIQHVLESVQNFASEVAIVTPPTTQELGEKKDVSFSPQPLVPLKSWWQKFFHRPTTNASLPQSLTIKDNSAQSLTLSTKEDSLKRHLPVVRGIATNLVNRNLVLVCTNNEILDILTPQQQAKLQDRIISEVAEYWHSWQLVEAQKETNLLPEINQLLAKLTGENTANMLALSEGTSKVLLNTGIIEFLDAVVANLEANAIIPVQQRSQEIVRVTQNQFNIFIYGKEQLTARGNIAVSDDLETHKLNLQALIAAAINYFFGVSQDKQLEMGNFDGQSQNKLRDRRTMILPKNSKLQNEGLVADPWLNWDDLFGNSQTIAQMPITSSSSKKSALASSPSTKLSPKNKLPVQPPKAGSGLVQRKKTSQNITPTQNTSKKVTSANSESREGEVSQQQFSQNSKVEAKPDWIEIKATSMGYVKHPLEQVLEWLDSAMLWLEKMFVNIFHFLQGLLGVKKASRD
ncbi:hypothetical protein JYQ62_23280 [Nostoc sp. UHCC 0702]|nr:hypothetical protein JYQ62_23280 [Nostoc sp. UHCC 0702]